MVVGTGQTWPVPALDLSIHRRASSTFQPDIRDEPNINVTYCVLNTPKTPLPLRSTFPLQLYTAPGKEATWEGLSYKLLIEAARLN